MQGEKSTEASPLSRRSDRDRRAADDRPLSKGNERRRSAERRLPIVDESAVSFSEWARSMVVFLATLRRRPKVKPVVRRSKPK